MPRRNRPSRRAPRPVVVEPEELQYRSQADRFEAMARDLVRRGLASDHILSRRYTASTRRLND